MKDIRELLVTQVRIFPVGGVPLDALMTTTGRAALLEAFGFPDPGIDLLPQAQQQAVVLQSGAFVSNGERVLVKALQFERRRILCQIFGTSAQAATFYGILATVVGSQAQEPLVDFILRTEETSCTVTLDLDFANIFRPSVTRFIRRRLAPAASEPRAPAVAFANKFAAKIVFDLQDQGIREHGITLNSKEFVVEPKVNTPVEDKVFFTKSPFPTDVHFELIEEFESLFARKP